MPSFRLSGADHPRWTVEASNPTPTGYRWVRLCRGVAAAARDGAPQWMRRAEAAASAAASAGPVSLERLAEIVRAEHKGRGVPASHRGR